MESQSPVPKNQSSIYSTLAYYSTGFVFIIAGVGLLVSYFKVSSHKVECIENTLGIQNFKNEFCEDLTPDTENTQIDKYLQTSKNKLEDSETYVAFDWTPSKVNPDSGTLLYYKGNEKNTNQCYKVAESKKNQGNVTVCFKLIHRNEGFAVGGAVIIVVGLVIITFQIIHFLFSNKK